MSSTTEPTGESAAVDKGDFRSLGVNEYGTPVSVHVCASCGDQFTVCPPFEGDYRGCLAPLCPSYDIERDVEYLLAAGQRLVRDDEEAPDGD